MRGGLLILASMALIGLIDNFVRFIAMEAGLWQFLFIRSLIVCPALLLFFLWKKSRIRPRRIWPVALRSVLVASAILIYFGSVSIMPIAAAGATLFSSPIFMLVFAVLWFQTKVGYRRIAAVAIGFAGVLLVLRPDINDLNLLTILPLLSGAFYALGQLITRHLCADENTSVVLFAFFLALGVMAAGGLVFFTFLEVPAAWRNQAPFHTAGWIVPTQAFFMWTLVQAAGSLFAVSGLVRGYQIGDPTFLGVFEYSFLIYAGFWSWVLWGELPDAVSLAGIVAICLAGVVIISRTGRSA